MSSRPRIPTTSPASRQRAAGSSGRGAGAAVEYTLTAPSAHGYLGARRHSRRPGCAAARAVTSGSYAVRFKSLPTWAPFSGAAPGGGASSLDPTPRLQLGLAYAGGRDDTRESVLSYWDHGPRAEVRLPVRAGAARHGPRAPLRATASSRLAGRAARDATSRSGLRGRGSRRPLDRAGRPVGRYAARTWTRWRIASSRPPWRSAPRWAECPSPGSLRRRDCRPRRLPHRPDLSSSARRPAL